MVAIEQLIAVLLPVVVALAIIWMISQMLGLSLGELFLGMRATARTRVDEEPRDQAERWISNHRKVSRELRPRALKFLAVAGDADVPPTLVGRVTGVEPHQEGYIIYAKRRRLSWSRPIIVPRELVSDLNRRTLVLAARGITTNGIYRYAVPYEAGALSPDEALDRADSLFVASFGAQALVDAREDAVWAMSDAFMPTRENRIKVAEVQAPRFVERPGVGVEERNV